MCSSACSIASQSMLCLAAEPSIGARHVQQCLWTGRNKPDARVPVTAPHYQLLLTKKSQQWQNDSSYNPYLSTSQVLLLLFANTRPMNMILILLFDNVVGLLLTS